MNTASLIFQFLATGFAVYMVLSELYCNKENLYFIWKIWKRFRFGMFLEISILIFSIVITYLFLNKYVSFLHYGWMHLLLKNGGNIFALPILFGINSKYFIIRILPPIFLFVFLLAVPFIANGEERLFRKGCHTYGKIIWRSFLFGMMHLTIGIPLSAGIALIIPGLFLAYKYECTYKNLVPSISKKEASHEAILVSTTYHTLMNSLLVVFLVVLTILCI